MPKAQQGSNREVQCFGAQVDLLFAVITVPQRCINANIEWWYTQSGLRFHAGPRDRGAVGRTTMRFRGRRPRTGRFTRPGHTNPPSSAPLDDPVLHSPPRDVLPPDPEVLSVQTFGPSQDSTAGLTDMG